MALRRLWDLAWPSLLALALVGIGVWAGVHYAAAPFSEELAHNRRTETLGSSLATPEITEHLTARQRENVFQAYLDPAEARAHADSISWGVPNLPTPFVGTAPWPGRHANADVDEYQFRFSGPLPVPKPARHCRIFLTGGSTAYGSGAPDQDRTIAGYLEAALNGSGAKASAYEVITAANPAWSSTHERILIENRLSELDPDLVVSLSGNNDVFWGEAGKDVLWHRIFADDYFLRLVGLAYRLGDGPTVPLPPEDLPPPVPPQAVTRRLAKNVELARHALALSNVPYLFALQPTLAVSGKTLSPREADFLDAKAPYFRQSYVRIREALANVEDPLFRFEDLSGVFDGYGADTEIFLDSFHFGDRGNELIANALLEAVLAHIADSGRCREGANGIGGSGGTTAKSP